MRCVGQQVLAGLKARKPLLPARNLTQDLRVLCRPLLGESLRVALVRCHQPHDLDPRFDLFGRAHLDRQAEAIEQLRAQLAFFRVAAADQHELRPMANREPFALDHVLTRGGDIQQQVHQVILEQVDFVDVEKPAMRLCQQARFKCLLPGAQGAFEIERADHPVLGCSQGQVDERHRALAHPARSAGIGAGALLVASAAIAAILDRADRRQQIGESACGGGLAGAAVAEYHHPADARIDRRDQQRLLHLVLTDDSGKGKTRHFPSLVNQRGHLDKH